MFDIIRQFLVERAKWKKAGKPMRSNDQIKKIFSICEKCEFFKRKNATTGNCGVCGCKLTNQKVFLNKVAWATTRCPLEEPKWVENEGLQNIEISEADIQVEEKLEEEEKEQLDTAPISKKKGCGCKG